MPSESILEQAKLGQLKIENYGAPDLRAHLYLHTSPPYSK
jgi:hypothetical protein